jgi:hypothetical protein
MRFPLPVGHVFGYRPNSLQWHDGSDLGADTFYLTHWQTRYQRTVDKEGVITGRFDGPTQRACIAVQQAHGLPVTAVLDEATWDALYRDKKPDPTPTMDTPILEPERPSERPRNAIKNANKETTGRKKTTSRFTVVPSWYPGERFGLGAVGPYVRRVRIILGMAVTDVYDEDLVARVRGVQQTSGLRRTGIIDEKTANAIDEIASAA